MNEKYIGALYLAIAASIWGGMYVVVKVTVAVVPPLELVWMRYAIAGIVLVFTIWRLGYSFQLDKKRYPAYGVDWADRKFPFNRDSRNWDDVYLCTNGGCYYICNSCVYGAVCFLSIKRSHDCSKVRIHPACDSRCMAHDWTSCSTDR